MSGPLAMAAVTAALKDLLNDGLLNHDLSSIGSFTVTSLPPDRITTGQTEPNQLNLFLYQVTPNLGWRNVGLPSRDRAGVRMSTAPLALDLHYMLTAYGAQDLNAEVLLGYAMQLLHETPVLTRASLRTVLGAPPPVDGSLGTLTPLPSPFGTLSAADLADQVEAIKISPVFMTTEELSKMWTAMQARYRPTMSYMVSVVLIEARASVRAAEPVLRQGPDDRGPVAVASAPPILSSVRPAASDLLPAMRLGDDLAVSGAGFDASGALVAVFENAREEVVREIALGAATSSTRLGVHVPSLAEEAAGMHEWAIGLYTVSLRVTPPEGPAVTSNAVPVALAPSVTVEAPDIPAGEIETLTVTPRIRPDQRARTSVLFGSRTIAPSAVATPANPAEPTTIEFVVPDVPPGEYLVRVRVDGVDSVPVVIAGSPPKMTFDPTQKVKVQ